MQESFEGEIHYAMYSVFFLFFSSLIIREVPHVIKRKDTYQLSNSINPC